MLTLGMAFIERPRLLMIDELSLGLAPSVVAQLLEIVRELRDAGTTIILVEQSVNVALTVAETAYFMEKGEIRFHGPTAELLERPDVLRSVFLEGAATRDGTADGDRVTDVDAGTVVPSPVATTAATDPTPVAAEARLEVRELDKRFGGVVALDDVSLTIGAGEIVGFIGPNGAGKTTLFDAISGLMPVDGGRVLMKANDGEIYDITDRPTQLRAQLGLGRSFQDGRLFPALTVAETIAVALDCSVEVQGPDRRGAVPPGGRRLRGRGRRPGRRADRPHGPRGVPGQVHAASSPPGAAGSSTSRASWPTDRRSCCSTSRRAASRSARPRRSDR